MKETRSAAWESQYWQQRSRMQMCQLAGPGLEEESVGVRVLPKRVIFTIQEDIADTSSVAYHLQGSIR